MSVIVKPLVTEKISAMNEHGKYGFVVEKSANKVEIKKEIERMYGVNVVKVNTSIQAGKTKRRYTKSGVVEGKTKSYKKAFVQLSEGEIIDFYSGI